MRRLLLLPPHDRWQDVMVRGGLIVVGHELPDLLFLRSVSLGRNNASDVSCMLYVGRKLLAPYGGSDSEQCSLKITNPDDPRSPQSGLNTVMKLGLKCASALPGPIGGVYKIMSGIFGAVSGHTVGETKKSRDYLTLSRLSLYNCISEYVDKAIDSKIAQYDKKLTDDNIWDLQEAVKRFLSYVEDVQESNQQPGNISDFQQVNYISPGRSD